MPIYDYQCMKCEATFDELVRNSREEKDVRCAECGSKKVERLVSAFAMGRGKSARKSCSHETPGLSRPCTLDTI